MNDPFYELAMTDPLCAAEGLDLKDAEQTLRAVEVEMLKLQREIASKSWRMRIYFLFHPLTRSAFPIPFVYALLNSERARRAYLADPTDSAKRNLKRLWLDAARTYERCVAHYRALFSRIVRYNPELTRKTLHDMAGNTYTIADVDATIKALEENARVLVGEARARLAGDDAPRAADPRPVPAASPTSPISEPNQWIEEFEDERVGELNQDIHRYGPIGYELPNFDGVPTVRQFNVYLARNKRTGGPYVWLHLRDKMSFLQIVGGKGIGRLTPTIFQPNVERGNRFFAQPLTFNYTMRDQQYMADLLTIVDLERRPRLNRQLVDSQRSSLFDHLLGKHLDELKRSKQMQRVRNRESDKAYSMGYAFFTHSNASLYFMPYNRSVWRIAPLSMLTGARTQPKDNLYVTVEGLLPQTREGLKDIVHAGRYRREVWKKQGLLEED